MKIYLVGGAVRDEILGLPVSERDYVVVGATERDMLDQGFRRLDAAFPVFAHPRTGDEYALARRETKTGPGYKGFSVEADPGVSLEEDLVRRDLTINALARDPQGRIIDLHGGRNDLDAGIMRHITPAFVEDPVRLLRAARFSAKLGRWGFRLAHKTFAMMREMAALDELSTVFPERFREEMRKALKTEQPWRYFQTLQRCGALARLLPRLSETMDVEVSHADGESAPVAALRRICAHTSDPSLRFAALMAAAGVADGVGEPGGGFSLDSASRDLLDRALDWPARSVADADADGLMQFIEAVRLTHHPDRLQQMRALWHAVDPVNADTAERRAGCALTAVRSVDTRALSASGLSGPDLGRAVKDSRLTAVRRSLQRIPSVH